MSWQRRHNIAKSLHKRLERDPVLRSRVSSAKAEYVAAFAPVRADLAKVGIHVEAAQELRWKYEEDGRPYLEAIPILAKWLPQVSLKWVRDDIARTMSMPWACDLSMPVLLAQFVVEPDPSVKWAIGSGIGLLACDLYRDSIVSLATDSTHGRARGMIVASLGRLSPAPTVRQTILVLLDDPDVYGYAVKAAGECRLLEALPKLERIAASIDQPWIEHRPTPEGIVKDRSFVMKEAAKAVKRIQAAGRRRI